MLLQTRRIATLWYLLLTLVICNQVNALSKPKSSLNIQNLKKWKTHEAVDFGAILAPGGSQEHAKAVDLQARGGAEIDKTDTWTMSDITVMDIVYLGISFSLLAAICLFCRNVSRTGGRAPVWITSWVADPYATGILHLGYFVLGALLPTILPAGLCRIIFAPPAVALMGTVFPAVESVRAAVTDSGSDDRMWLMYWVVYGIFQYSTEFIDQLAQDNDDIYKYWHTFEVLSVLWLLLPITDGAALICKSFECLVLADSYSF